MRAGIAPRVGVAALSLAVVACASSPDRRASPPARDRTNDPEFVAALEAAEREFETQADALAAGVYEPFVHPDSVGVRRPAPAFDFGEDPSTEELLGTLPPTAPYNRTPEMTPADRATPPSATVTWTLQVGAFGAETGALVRLRQLARDFPDLPRWHTVGGGVFRVFVGRFPDRGTAEQARAEAVARGYADAWIVAAP